MTDYIINEHNQFSYFLNHPLLKKYELQSFIITNSESFKLVIANIGESIYDILHESNAKNAVSPNSLFAKHRTVFLTKENVSSFNINLNHISIQNIAQNVFKTLKVDILKYDSFMIDLVKESRFTEELKQHNSQFYLHVLVPLLSFNQNNFFNSMSHILHSIKNLHSDPQKNYVELLKFENLLKNTLNFKFIANDESISKEDISKIIFLKKIASLENDVKIIVNEQPIPENLKYIFDIIQDISLRHPDFSFKNSDPDIDKLAQNLDKINFFKHYENMESLFYDVKETSHLFDNIYSSKKEYPYHGTFGFSKEKLLMLCEPSQYQKYIAYLCHDLFQHFLDTANLYCGHDYVYIGKNELNNPQNDHYTAYLYSEKPIDIVIFQRMFQEAILTYKKVGDPDFNPEVINHLFQEQILEIETPKNKVSEYKPRKF